MFPLKGPGWPGMPALLVAFVLPLQAATPPALSNPDVAVEPPLGAAYQGDFSGNAAVSAGGNASYTLPIQVPPGTNGMAPQLSLNYNSNMRNGMLGLGWFMQGASSRITRCPQNYSQDGQIRAVDYSAEDRFCLDGNRLVAVAGSYGADGTEYRTETDAFSRIISHGAAGATDGACRRHHRRRQRWRRGKDGGVACRRHQGCRKPGNDR